MHFYHKLVILIFCTLLFACNKTQGPAYTPEEVLRLYQGYVDSNKFEDAKKFCTVREGERLDNLAKSISNEYRDSTIFTTTFLKVNCRDEADRIICNCLIQDDYEKYAADYILVKNKGNWLVDAPDEVIIIKPDEVEQMLDEFVNDPEGEIMY